MQCVSATRKFKAIALIVAWRDRGRALWPWFSGLWLAAFVALFFLYVLPGAAPPTSIAGVELDLDKLFHAVAHGSLMAMPIAIVPDNRLALAMAVLAICSAVLFECAQLYVPQRSFGLDDMTANMVGVVIGGFLGRAIRRL